MASGQWRPAQESISGPPTRCCALNSDPERYFLELPKGMKPGKAQAEADRVAEMSEAELNEAREKDPQFGKGS